MNPSLILGFGFFIVGALTLTEMWITGRIQPDVSAGVGALLITIGAVVVFQSKRNPLISEYTTLAYLILFGLALATIAIATQILIALV